MKFEKILISDYPFREGQRKLAWPDRGFWPAYWITLDGDERIARSTAYRCRFSCKQNETYRLHVCGDAVYRLYCDGELVGTGPEQGDLNHTFFDTFECEFTPGIHTLTAIVTSFGQSGPLSRMSFRHGWLLAAEGDGAEKLDSNAANWQAMPLPGHRFEELLYGTGSVGQGLCFDAAGVPEGVEKGDGDNWLPVDEREPGSDGVLRNEYAPTPRLHPATLPEFKRRPLPVPQLLFAGADDGTNAFRTDQNDPRERDAWREAFQSSRPRTIPARRKIKLLLQLDNYHCAVPELRTSGGKNARIRLGWSEALFLDDDPGCRSKGNRNEWENRFFHGIYDTFLPDGRNGMEFYTVHYRAGRYLSLEIATGDEALTLEAFRLFERRYPVEFTAEFDGGDPHFRWLAENSRRTLEMCSQDTFMDCPYYEQLMYLGDTRIQALLTLTVGRDTRLVEKALRFFDAGRLPVGFCPSRYPSRVTQLIPTFTPYWIGMLRDFALWRGCDGVVAEKLPSARHAMEAFEKFFNGDGLVQFDISWNFVDWTGWKFGTPPGGEFGVSGIVNTLILYGFGQLVELLELAEETELAAYYRRRGRAFAERIVQHFFDPASGLFMDTEGATPCSEHPQILALLSGLLPEEVARTCEEKFLSADLPVKATVYFSFYLFELYRKIRRPDLFRKRLELFFDMEKMGLQTMLEAPEPSRSDCHAWSAHPLYYCYALILGIQPIQAGFRAVEIAPQDVGLRHVRGSVPHPDGGSIAVDWTPERAVVELPPGIPGTFVTPTGERIELHAGINQLNYSR